MSPRKSFAGLTQRQRDALIAALEGGASTRATESPTVTVTPRSPPTEGRGGMEPLQVSLRRAKETKNTVRYGSPGTEPL